MFGRRRVPESVRARALQPGERRAGWGVTATGDTLVATDLGLYLPGTPGRVDWPDVEKAAWQRPHLEITEVAEVSGTGRRWRFELADEGGLPDLVRSKVSASVAWTTHVPLTPEGGVRVVGRRRPGREVLDWQLVYDQGIDRHDPAVQARAEAALLDARRTIG